MTYLDITAEIAAPDSDARNFVEYAFELLGGDQDREDIDFDSSEEEFSNAIARNYEQLAGLERHAVTVELCYNWPYRMQSNT